MKASEIKFKREGLNRLARLGKYLSTVPRERFDMADWATTGFCGEAKEPKHKDCGSAGCALGWACTLPSFKAKGLHLDKDFVPEFKNRHGFTAGSMFFRIDMNDSEYLFGLQGDGISGTTPKQVAKSIKELVKLRRAGLKY